MKIYEITSCYPVEEKYGLISDTKRSANSVIASIAESHGRYYFADKVRVLYIARGEIEETRSHLKVAQGRRYIERKVFEELDQEYEKLSMSVSKYIQSLSKSKKRHLINQPIGQSTNSRVEK